MSSSRPQVDRRSILLPSAIALITLFVVGQAGRASAQAIDIPAIMDPDFEARPATGALLQYGHQFKTDVENNGTEMARENAFFAVAHRIKAGEQTAVSLMGGYTLQAYDFSGGRNTTGATPGSRPATQNYYQWDDVHRGVLGVLVGHDLNDRWRLMGGGLVRSWGESGANFGDTLSGGLMGGFDYHPSEDFSVGLIVGVISQLEGGVGIVPVPTMKWQFAEDWKWTVGLVSIFDPGVGSELAWQVSDTVSIGAGFAFQTRRFRLQDKNRAGNNPGRPNRNDDGGVGQESELPIFAIVRWRPTPKSSLDLLGGVATAGNVRVEDEDGGRIADDSYDAAPFLGLRGQIFF